jgi:Uma2 family endonuclease
MAWPWRGRARSRITFQIEANILGELFQRLRGKICRPLGSNLAVRLAGAKAYVFPDVTVVCGTPEYVIKGDIGCLLNPSVVVEVLSKSTAARDETGKLAYAAIPHGAGVSGGFDREPRGEAIFQANGR